LMVLMRLICPSAGLVGNQQRVPALFSAR